MAKGSTGNVRVIGDVYYTVPCTCESYCIRSYGARQQCAWHLTRTRSVKSGQCKRHGLYWHVQGRCLLCYPAKECVFDG